MLYLKASTDIEILNEFNGEQGKFIKTFGFNTKRNKNGWRVSWDSIKKRISDFLDKPGIEFVKCEGTVCDLDHIEGATFEQSLAVQEDFRVTDIIDYILDENTETVHFIHKVRPGNEEFWDKVKKRIIKAVSPSIWLIPGQFIVDGVNEKGQPKIDVFDWLALHDAFLTKNPAYGDAATITSTCEGKNCHMRLLSTKEYKGSENNILLKEKIKNVTLAYPDWSEDRVREKAMELIQKDSAKNASDDLAPLQEIPLLVRHKNKLRFVSISKDVSDKINFKIKAGQRINERMLVDTIREIENSSNLNSNTSFSSCSCSANHAMTLNDEEIKKLQDAKTATEEKVKELESKLKASEDEKEKLDAKLKASEESESDKVKEAKKHKKNLKRNYNQLRMKTRTSRQRLQNQ